MSLPLTSLSNRCVCGFHRAAVSELVWASSRNGFDDFIFLISMSSSSSRSTTNPFVLLFRFVSSFGLAVTVLSLLLVITLLGTLSQSDIGLLDSQRKYFDSWSVVHDFHVGSTVIPIWLPGGMALMMLLFVNMACGAVIRMRKGWKTVGVLISHLSIMFMLAAGYVSYLFKTEGALPLFEGQSGDLYQSYHDRVIEVRKFDAEGKGEATTLMIPMEDFMDLEPGKARTFYSKDLPFELLVTGYQRNAQVVPKQEEGASVIDGFGIQPVRVETTDEQNLSALVVTVTPKDGGAVERAILWEAAFEPFTVKAGKEAYTLSLTRRKWKLPFALRLEDFQRELHPGTEKPKRYTSHVTKIDNGNEQPQVITMNVPMRDRGFVLYQASFSQGTSGEQSVFTVASNPSDQWPLWSCVAVAFGLTIHFVMHLAQFLKRTLKPKDKAAA
jgi:hypothetical protein